MRGAKGVEVQNWALNEVENSLPRVAKVFKSAVFTTKNYLF